MQALDRLVGVYATFEDAWANLENENSESDIMYSDACGAMDEVAKAQQHQARCQDEVKGCRENLDAIVRVLTNFQALLEVACDDLADAGVKTIDLKKAEDAHSTTYSHRMICGPGDQGSNSGGKAAVKRAWTSSSGTHVGGYCSKKHSSLLITSSQNSSN